MSTRGRCHPHAAAVRSGSLEPGIAPPPLGTIHIHMEKARPENPATNPSASFDDHSFGLFNLTPWDVFAVLQVFQD